MGHTERKWKVCDGAVLSEKVNDYGNFIIVSCDRERTQEDEDNLRFIAAAPKLLAACKRYVKVQEALNKEMGRKPSGVMYNIMVEAIAEAEDIS